LAQAVDAAGNVALALDHGQPFTKIKTAVEFPALYLPLVAKNYSQLDLSLFLPLIMRE
jgi:hypothetical protein